MSTLSLKKQNEKGKTRHEVIKVPLRKGRVRRALNSEVGDQ